MRLRNKNLLSFGEKACSTCEHWTTYHNCNIFQVSFKSEGGYDLGFGSKAVYSCVEGYLSETENIFTCSQDGSWKGTIHPCTEVRPTCKMLFKPVLFLFQTVLNFISNCTAFSFKLYCFLFQTALYFFSNCSAFYFKTYCIVFLKWSESYFCLRDWNKF